MPVVLGHEGAGVVTRVGEGVADLAVGDHVVLSGCRSAARAGSAGGAAVAVRAGRGRRRPRRRAYDGTSRWGGGRHHYLVVSSFAERVVVPRSGAVRIRATRRWTWSPSSAVRSRPASAPSATPPPSRGRDRRRDRLWRGRAVMLQGARLAARRGSWPATSTRPSWRWRCASAPPTPSTRRGDPVTAPRSCARGLDYVFDAIGRIETTEQAIGALGPGGAAVVVGLPPTGRRRASIRSRSPRPTSASWVQLRLGRPPARHPAASSTATWTASSTSTVSSPGAGPSEAAEALDDLAAGRTLRTLLITDTSQEDVHVHDR